MTPRNTRLSTLRLALGATALTLIGSAAFADQVILDDLIVDGSICAGQDCVNGESFGFDTLRLKENNLRIKAQDTSTSASFPTNDWQITFNESSNGGANKFSIDDIDGGRTPFTIEAGAPSHSLFVDDGGRIGLGTSTPVVEIHVKDGDTPTIRLEQDGSSGFTPQTWDLAGNETNFFIRDATNASRLPFKIRPGAATDALVLEADGDVTVGSKTGADAISGLDGMIIGTTATAATEVLRLTSAGTVFSGYEDRSVAVGDNTGRIWNVQNVGGEFRVTTAPGGAGEVELAMNAAGDVTLSGTLTTTGGATCSVTPCDAVFDPALYTVPSIEDHAAVMWRNKYLPAVGPTGADQAINVSEKMLRMLNELEHAHIYIEQLNAQLKQQGTEIEELRQMVTMQ